MECSRLAWPWFMSNFRHFQMSKGGGGGGGGFFLACEDFGRMFDNSFSACDFLCVFVSGD